MANPVELLREGNKNTRQIYDKICCLLKSYLSNTGADSDPVLETSGVVTVAALGNTLYTFTEPVSAVEIKAQSGETTTVDVVTDPVALGNSQITLFANDYQTIKFDSGTKIVSVTLTNNDAVNSADYIINGIR